MIDFGMPVTYDRQESMMHHKFSRCVRTAGLSLGVALMALLCSVDAVAQNYRFRVCGNGLAGPRPSERIGET